MEEETSGMMQNNKYACLGDSVSCAVVMEGGGELLEYSNNNVDEKDEELIMRDTNENVEGEKDEQIPTLRNNKGNKKSKKKKTQNRRRHRQYKTQQADVSYSGNSATSKPSSNQYHTSDWLLG